jgi:hypothetical protein
MPAEVLQEPAAGEFVGDFIDPGGYGDGRLPGLLGLGGAPREHQGPQQREDPQFPVQEVLMRARCRHVSPSLFHRIPQNEAAGA